MERRRLREVRGRSRVLRSGLGRVGSVGDEFRAVLLRGSLEVAEVFVEGLWEAERVRWGEGSRGRGLEDGGVRLRGWVLGESGEGLREGAIAY